MGSPYHLHPQLGTLLFGGAEQIVFPFPAAVCVSQLEGKTLLLGIGVIWCILGRVQKEVNPVTVGFARLFLVEVHKGAGENAEANLPRFLALPTQFFEISLASHILELTDFDFLVLWRTEVILPLSCRFCTHGDGSCGDVGTGIHCSRPTVLGREGGSGSVARGWGQNGFLVELLLGTFLLGGGLGRRCGSLHYSKL